MGERVAIFGFGKSMANSLFKLGRLTMIGALMAASAAACGGRGNLPTGSVDDDDGEDAGSSFGGASTTAGAPSKSGAGTGGRATAGTSGSVGAAGENVGGTGVIAGCGPSRPCLPPFTCQAGVCLKESVCKPGSQQCDANGRVLLRCVASGASYEAVDCVAQGQLCRDDACRSLACSPGQLFCKDNTLWRCNDSGSGAAAKQNCVEGEYCDGELLTCRPGVCSPNQPACKGETATVCNRDGSGYLGGGTDCSLMPDHRCYLGSCLCEPNQADCNGIVKDGCEVDVITDPDNCSGCSIACSANHMATRSCDGSCNGTCQAGYDDCNGDKQLDGCETRVDSNPDDCGGCGISCSDNHIEAACSGGVCNGKCQASFKDCNGDKQADGCESDSRTDEDNCGSCGAACSGNHVARLCKSGKCTGACTSGFADCNGNKKADGCEVDTRRDDDNCGACGNVCPEGESCRDGECGSRLTFSGIAQDLPVSSLVGWHECFSDFYGESAPLSQVLADCTGSQLMMACRELGSDILQLAAYAPVADVMFDTGEGDVPHNANGVGWYYHDAQSWGFAPEGDPIHRYTCDIVDSALEAPGVDGDKRLCWHTANGYVSSGWRCGRNDLLNSDFGYERVLFTAP